MPGVPLLVALLLALAGQASGDGALIPGECVALQLEA
jgi:hypothetical protein